MLVRVLSVLMRSWLLVTRLRCYYRHYVALIVISGNRSRLTNGVMRHLMCGYSWLIAGIEGLLGGHQSEGVKKNEMKVSVVAYQSQCTTRGSHIHVACRSVCDLCHKNLYTPLPPCCPNPYPPPLPPRPILPLPPLPPSHLHSHPPPTPFHP